MAEDDAAMRELVVDALKIEDFQVDEAGDGRTMWVRTIQRASYDLIVSDLRLPVVDGLTVVEDLLERAPGTRVIMMTAFADDAVRVRAETLGVMLIDKPFKMAELRAAARLLCQRAAQQGAP